MFYRHQDFAESYVHQCEDAHRYNKDHLREIARVRKHDCHTFMVVGGKIEHIKYCPYCGVDLEKDSETEEFLKLNLKER